ncbi:MAG: rhamnulokinase, partial [Candidatus Helarchaeota archaeon]|nr:rhamnulokinase [Candidatus Helarchaeota archaeon]
GPSEATAIGNILVQILALGEIKNIRNLRQIVKKSFQIKEFTPMDSEKWNNAYKEYLKKIK